MPQYVSSGLRQLRTQLSPAVGLIKELAQRPSETSNNCVWRFGQVVQLDRLIGPLLALRLFGSRSEDDLVILLLVELEERQPSLQLAILPRVA